MDVRLNNKVQEGIQNVLFLFFFFLADKKLKTKRKKKKTREAAALFPASLHQQRSDRRVPSCQT